MLVSYERLTIRAAHCVDVEPPSLVCPANISLPAQPKLYYAAVSWAEPLSYDNSGFHPLVTSLPVVVAPMMFKIGTTEVQVRLRL